MPLYYLLFRGQNNLHRRVCGDDDSSHDFYDSVVCDPQVSYYKENLFVETFQSFFFFKG